jgi:DNA helicase-2/ATP-dependent DNA helicase PcrA
MESTLLQGLNEKQIEAVTTTQGYVRIIASAGSGKTKALTVRYAYLVECLGISPANILCVTFTNKAAQELKKRIRSMVTPGNSNDFISTYHGFCVKVLREEIYKLSYPKSFIVMDTEDQVTILREIFEELNITSKDLSFKKAIRDIQLTKIISNGYYIKEYIEPFSQIEINPELKLEDKIFISYIKKQKKNYALDFDDLILFSFYIFLNHPAILAKWQNRLNYIMVDETQDNSSQQWGLVAMISNKYKNLCVVGDPDQSIYEWRGASPEALVKFDKKFEPCTTIIMDENYRSTPDVLNVANCIIKNNKNRIDKDMFTKKANGAKVTHFHGKTEYEEGLWVAQTILNHQEKGASLKDFAILYRASHVTRNIEQALIKKGIPYIIYGGIRFFERKEIKDAISYLRLVNSNDDFSFLRVLNSPSRKLGKVFVNNLKTLSEGNNTSLYETLKANIDLKDFNKEGARFFIKLIEECRDFKDELSISDLMQYIITESGIEQELRLDGEEERLENIEELMASIKMYENENINEENISLADYLQDIALYTNLDLKEETEFVKLMTIHQAKGLEFNYVFVCGMSEGIMPSYRSLRERKIKAMEEERRLAYVAITRAKEELFLTESEGFNFVNNMHKYPSRFIFEIKEEFLVIDGVLTEELKQEARTTFKKFDDSVLNLPELLEVENNVVHPVFGNGKIIAVNEETQTYSIQFDRFELPLSINFSFRKLTLVENA